MKNFTHNPTITHVAILIIAATTAYITASATTFINPTIATLIAVISVKQTLHETLQETSYQMVGTLIGAAAALTLSNFFGFQWWTIPIFIITSFLLSIILKLGLRGGTVITITIIFITAPFIDETITSQQRILGVTLGILVAAVASLIPIKQQPHKTLHNNIIDTQNNLNRLLHTIGNKLATGHINPTQLTGWTIEAETERNKIREYNQTFTMLEKTQKWSPTLTKQKLHTLKNMLNHATQQALATKSITKILEKINTLDTPPHTAVIKIGKIIEQTYTPDANTTTINTIPDNIHKDTLEKLDNTQAIILTGNLYSEAEKLKQLRKNRNNHS